MFVLLSPYLLPSGYLLTQPRPLGAQNTPSMVRGSQHGRDWNDSGLHLVPRWTREPPLEAIESVYRRQLGIRPEYTCTVSSYAVGTFNKLYLVSTDNPLLIRVLLPVHPRLKTCGEVATLQWVHDNTNIPVLKVVAFQDSNENEIGFEWILMELMPSTSAYRRWHTLSMKQKTAFSEHLAEFQAQLSRYSNLDGAFRNIGTLHLDSETEILGLPKTFVPSQLISHEFFMGDHLRYSIPRGPFHSSHDWLNSELNIIILEQTAAIEKAEDEDDREDAKEHLRSAQKLLSLLPKVFPENQDSPEFTSIFYDELNLKNILVDDEGTVTAIVD